jgi:hypothetical protein
MPFYCRPWTFDGTARSSRSTCHGLARVLGLQTALTTTNSMPDLADAGRKKVLTTGAVSSSSPARSSTVFSPALPIASWNSKFKTG